MPSSVPSVMSSVAPTAEKKGRGGGVPWALFYSYIIAPFYHNFYAFKKKIDIYCISVVFIVVVKLCYFLHIYKWKNEGVE